MLPLLYVLDDNFEKEGVLDSYSTFYYTNRFNDYNFGEIKMSIDEPSFKLLKKEKIIYMDQYNHWFVESIDINQEIATIKLNSFLKNMLYRVTIPDVGESHIAYKNEKIDNIIYGLIDKCCINPMNPLRIIPFLSTNSINVTNISIEDFKSRYKQLFWEVIKLARMAKIGFRLKVDLLHKKFVFELYKGSDKQNEVRFSEKYDNILDVNYQSSNKDHRNVCYVLGQGEMQNRNIAVYSLEDKEYSGLKRKEIARDARDIGSKENTEVKTEVKSEDTTEEKPEKPPMSKEEEIAAMKVRAIETFEEHKNVEVVECEIVPDSTYKLGEDYNLGDIVSINSLRYNYKYSDIISEINIEYTREKGKTVGLVIGEFKEPTTSDENADFD